MTRRLYLLRHAKASPALPGMSDFDRPLAKRGHDEAEEVAAFIAASGNSPARIVCSSSRRTRETIAPLIPELEGEVEVRLTRAIYEATTVQLSSVIAEHGGNAESLMLVGHNPAIEELAKGLAETGSPERITALRAGFPPAALAVIEFEGRWRSLGPGRLLAFQVPARE